MRVKRFSVAFTEQLESTKQENLQPVWAKHRPKVREGERGEGERGGELYIILIQQTDFIELSGLI